MPWRGGLRSDKNVYSDKDYSVHGFMYAADLDDPTAASRVKERQEERIRVLTKPRTGWEHFENFSRETDFEKVKDYFEGVAHYYKEKMTPE